MGISFDKRKLKIKIIQQESKIENIELDKTIQAIPEIKIEKKNKKVSRDFKETLKEIANISINNLNLSDFSVYSYYSEENRIKFSKILGNLNLSNIILEKYLSFSDITIIRRATGLSEAEEFRSSLIILFFLDNKNYILIWSSILYEIFSREKINKIKKLLFEEMRNEL